MKTRTFAEILTSELQREPRTGDQTKSLPQVTSVSVFSAVKRSGSEKSPVSFGFGINPEFCQIHTGIWHSRESATHIRERLCGV